MDTETYLIENMTVLFFYVAIAFFLLGLSFGWIVWGRGRSEESGSLWYSGHPHPQTSIAPLLNPAAYSKVRVPGTQSAPVQNKVDSKPGKTESPKTQKTSGAKAAKPETTAPPKTSGKDSTDAGENDPTLGLLYSSAPANTDDLTAIKGVGKVLNGKLNDMGVYTYQQIANWNDSIIAEFSKRLSFKDRVQRDDWINQARALHKEKYGADPA